MEAPMSVFSQYNFPSLYEFNLEANIFPWKGLELNTLQFLQERNC